MLMPCETASQRRGDRMEVAGERAQYVGFVGGERGARADVSDGLRSA